MVTIGELAKAAEVPISTVRYYERAGILKAHRRSASNYRLSSALPRRAASRSKT
jgi:MerR family mercuric resistance operon transcriptional regulator